MFEYRDLTNSSDYDGNYVFTNYLLYVYDETKFLNVTDESDAKRILTDYFRTFNKITNQNDIENYADLTILLNKWADGNKQAHSIKSYYVLAKSLNGFDILDWDGEKQNHYKKIDEAMVLASTGREITKGDNTPKDKRDGYYFNHYDDMDVDYNNSDEETVKIKDFMYSNYTLDTDDCKDINYVKFWYESNENKPLVLKTGNTDRIESLFEYKAGDMHQNTLCTYGSYRNKKWIDLYKGSKNTTAISLGNNNYLVSINNRILAAFPAALFSEDFSNTKNEFHKSTENMNMVTNYNEPNDTGKDEGKYKGASIVGKDKDMYRLVDVVIEDENEQQFVVPFICIDAKSVHLLPNYDLANKKGMFSIFTDNRYGQVMEQITDSNPVTYNYYKYRINLWNQEIWFPEDMALVAEQDIINGINTYTNLGKMIKYYDKDNARIVNHISLIEPYINIGGSNTGLNNIITSVICGKGVSTQKPNCRIVSMRVYDEKCADINGNVDTSGTWGNRQEEIDETSTYKLLNVLSDGYTSIYDYYKDNKFKKIVRY